jgi:hypothetical protein
VSYQATPLHRFTFFQQYADRLEVGGVDPLTSYDSREVKPANNRFLKTGWEGVRGSSLIASALYGYFGDNRYSSLTTGDTIVGTTDIATERVTGEAVTAGEDKPGHRHQFKADLTWYKPDFWHGNHEFKAGFDFQKYQDSPGTSERPTHNYHLLFNEGVPHQLAAFNFPGHPKLTVDTFNLFLRDNWTMGRRFTLSVGLRYSRDDARSREACRTGVKAPGNVAFPDECFAEVALPIFNSVAPRVHIAYDLFGNAKTVIKGGWGRYDHLRQLESLERVAKLVPAYAIYTWRDLNGNNDYDVGEVNLDPNGADFVQTVGSEFDYNPPPTGIVNPDEKQPKNDEYSVTLEHQVMTNLSVRVTGIYSRNFNAFRQQNPFRPYEAYNIPITNPDPGPDGNVGTPDDPGTTITYFEFAPELAGAEFEAFRPVADSRADQTYKSIDLAAVKRLSDRWQFMASYSATRKNRPLYYRLEVGGQNLSDQAADDNPNAEINQSDQSWDWNSKISGVYMFPWDITASANFEHRSGTVYARQVLLEGGTTIPDIVVNAEPLGSRRLPNLNLLTVGVEKSFRVADSQSARIRFSIYNAFNSNATIELSALSGDEFLLPTAILPPRIAEFTLSYVF